MFIWEAHLFKRLILNFLFLFLAIFVLYTLIDFSIQGVKIISMYQSSPLGMAQYYLDHFSLHFDFFSSLTFLLAALKVLIELRTHSELTALQVAGISKKKLIRPFVVLSLLLCLGAYANYEWIMPKAAIQTMFVRREKKSLKSNTTNLFQFSLGKHSALIYGQFDPVKKELLDIYWIQTADEIWHLKRISFQQSLKIGYYVDCFVRAANGTFQKTESFQQIALPHLDWNEQQHYEQTTPPDHRSLSSLCSQATYQSSEKFKLLAHFYHKLAFPFIPLMSILAISHYALRFSRRYLHLLLTSVALFTLIGLHVFFNGMLLLADNKALSPEAAIWGPFGLCFIFSLVSFCRLR